MFLGTLAEMCRRTGALIHSYVLMGNHCHPLLETPEPNLVAGMKWFVPTASAHGTVSASLGSGHLHTTL